MIALFSSNIRRHQPAATAAPGSILTRMAIITPGESGVRVQVKSPAAYLSGTYPWEWVPKGMAALRILVDVEPYDTFVSLVGRVSPFIGGEDNLDRFLGRDGRNAAELFNAGRAVMLRCPDPTVVRMADTVCKMPHRELSQYMEQLLV